MTKSAVTSRKTEMLSNLGYTSAR